MIDPGESCDQNKLNSQTCATQGFAGGRLGCSGGCVFDTSGCWNARFADNADGTITDRQSGPMWEKKTEADGATNYANAHDSDNQFLWAGYCSTNTTKNCQPTTAAATLCAANADGLAPLACDECTGFDGTCSAPDTIWSWAAALNGGSGFAGHSDWRIPKLQELVGIVNYADGTAPAVDVAFMGANCGPTCTDITDPACSCTEGSQYYWSASGPGTAWSVFFGTGNVVNFWLLNGGYVRAVRDSS